MGMLKEIYDNRLKISNKLNADDLIENLQNTSYKAVKNDDTSIGITYNGSKADVLNEINSIIVSITGIDSSLRADMLYHVYDISSTHFVIKLF